MSGLVLRQDIGGVALLVLNRPGKLNALSPELFDELAMHLDAIEAVGAGVTCVVICGEGRSFCAGADMDALQQRVVTEDPEFRSKTIQRLGDLPLPVIAAVHGHCYTGGLELALAADIIVASEDARFCDTHAKLGILPRWGLSVRLPRRIGLSAAKRMSFSGRPIEAAEALRIGLCDHVVKAEELRAFALQLANEIAANGRTAGQVKRLYSVSLELSLFQALDFERRSSDPGGGTGRRE